MIGPIARLREDRGVVLVEFALVVPIVLFLLVACIDFARVVNASVTIQNASREAARYATVNPQEIAETRAAYESRIHGHLTDRVLPLDPGLLSISITSAALTDPRCAGVAPTSCQWAAGQPTPTSLTVSVSYPWAATTWVIGPMLLAATTSPSLSASTTMESVQ